MGCVYHEGGSHVTLKVISWTLLLQSYKVLHYKQKNYNLLVIWATLAVLEVFQDCGEVGQKL